MRNAIASLAIWLLLFLNLCMGAEVGPHGGHHGGHHVVEMPGVGGAAPLRNVLARDVFDTTFVLPATRHEDPITSYYTTLINMTGSWTTLLPAVTPKPRPTSIAPVPASVSKTATPLTPLQSSSRVIASSSAVNIGTGYPSTSPTILPWANAGAKKGTVGALHMVVAIIIAALVVHIFFML